MSFFAIEQIFAKLDIIPEIRNKENPITLRRSHSSIEFNNVCFEYVKDKPILKNINLKVRQGETLAGEG